MLEQLLAAFYLKLSVGTLFGARPPPAGTYWIYDMNKTKPPYVLPEVGLKFEKGLRYGRLCYGVDVRHQSSTATGFDHGFDIVETGIEWHPFRGR